jgi:aryl-alcohol dehydrogenase-like predicted oxidoreductase
VNLAQPISRAHAPRFTGANFGKNKTKVELLQELAKQKGCTPSQLALAWALHQGNDILPLSDTTQQSRLKENIEASEIKLTTEELDFLD